MYSMKSRKALVWMKGEVKTPPFSREAKIGAGILLRKLQDGENLSMPHARPMPGVGKRCHELRINDEKVTWRIMCHIAKDYHEIVILDVFPKKTGVTPKKIIDACKSRLKRYYA